MTPLVFVTGNIHKLAEVQAILSSGDTPLEIIARDIDLPELQGTTEEIARDKCHRAAEIIGGPCFTEDTALCFKALGDLPGPYVKWFVKSIGNEGLVKLLEGFPTKEATAVTTFAFSPGPNCEPILFEGSSEGRIVSPPRGPSGFGWTPIFEEAETGLTFAEMPMEVKNKVSQRYKALEKLRLYLQKNPPPSTSTSTNTKANVCN